jgi:hypothetical protein
MYDEAKVNDMKESEGEEDEFDMKKEEEWIIKIVFMSNIILFHSNDDDFENNQLFS